MLQQVTLVVYLVLILNHGVSISSGQVSESLRLPERGENCVIRVDCEGGQDMPRIPGAPGKMGPVGPIGPKGMKGEIGTRGPKGENGRDADVNQIKTEILEILGATSCEELEANFGVNRAGYYLMRNSDGRTQYNYCDFQIHEGTSSCEDLRNKIDLVTGFYRFRNGGSATPSFVKCLGIFTCEQLQQYNGETVSGVYTMSQGNNPYQVHCDFSSGEAVTEVWHDSMQELQISSCEAPGCYTRTPQYEIDQNSILKIIENSRECRQFIKWRCKGSVLFDGNGRNGYGWWVSRQDDKMTYWGGATSRRDKYCACGETGTCINNRWNCNCDNNDNAITTQDEGFLTDESKLPVKTLRFGDASVSNSEAGWHTLGKFECMGQA